MDRLMNDGYYLISPTDFPERYSIGYDIERNIVDNVSVKRFIEHVLLPRVEHDLNTEPIRYNKFRYSDNNNVDAQTFHSDVYNYSHDEHVPIYTCLFYFDDSNMELIPQSHLKSNRVTGKCVSNYNGRQILNIPKNTILVINSVILHRGLNFVAKRRRLLQLFNCFFSSEDFDCYSCKTHIVNTYCIMKYIYPRYNSDVHHLINFFLYVVMYFDLQYKMVLLDIPEHEKQGKYISYVPGKSMMFTETSETNVNVICDDYVVVKQPSFFYGYIVISLLMIVWYIKKKK